MIHDTGMLLVMMALLIGVPFLLFLALFLGLREWANEREIQMKSKETDGGSDPD